MNASNGIMKKTYFDFDDNDSQQDDDNVGPWHSNPKNIYSTLAPKTQNQLKDSKQIIYSQADRKRQELNSILYKKPSQTKSLDLQQGKQKYVRKQKKFKPPTPPKKEGLLPKIAPKQYTHKLKRETHLPIITARQEYGEIFKYTKPSIERTKFDDIVVHDELRSHSFRKKQKNRYLYEKPQKQHSKLIDNIETLIGKQTPIFNIYEKCIVQVRKKNIKDRNRLRNSLTFV